MRRLRGKNSHHRSRGSPLDRTTSVEDNVGRCPDDFQGYNARGPLGMDAGADGLTQRLRTSTEGLYRHSLDLHRSYSHERSSFSRRNSDDSSSSINRRNDSIMEDVNDSLPLVYLIKMHKM